MLSLKAVFGLVLGLALAVPLLAETAVDDKVVKLTAADYEDKISDGKLYFVKYFAPWCGHCKRLAPTWTDLAKSLQKNENIVIASVDCTQHQDVCKNADVKGYPTLKLVYKGNEHKAYRGQRDLESLKDFAEDAAEELFEESE